MNLAKKFKKINNQEGFSALLTLLIMGVVLTISLSISALMVSEIKMVGAYDDSVIAYYAADAGIEDSLLNIKNGMPLVNHDTAPIYTIDAPSETSQANGSLSQDKSVEVNIPSGANRPNTVTIKWTNTGKQNEGDADGTSRCAVEWTLITYVDDRGSVSLPGDAGCNIDKGFYDGISPYDSSSPSDKPGNCGIPYYASSTKDLASNKIYINLSGDSKYAYKLRFKCLACTKDVCNDANSYSLTYTITGDGQINTGGMTIGSTGQSNNSGNAVRRKVTVDVNLSPQLNGIFDYVLYSEDPLSKPGS